MKHIPMLLKAGVPQSEVEAICERTKKVFQDEQVRDFLDTIEGFAPVDADGKADLWEECEAERILLK